MSASVAAVEMDVGQGKGEGAGAGVCRLVVAVAFITSKGVFLYVGAKKMKPFGDG